MQNFAATLHHGGLGENADQNGKSARQSPPRRGAGVMRFTYASGARPLDGFTIKRGIGVGGFGEVYFATSDAGKEVALKHIQRNLDVELRGVTQCLNLKHVNLLALYDIKYDQDGGAWVVMEYVGGESLKEAVERSPNGMPIDEVLRWFDGMAAGVSYLHDHGIVHRDLKPGNIFLDGDIVKIGDYGLSKFISCSRRSGQTESVGTFHYMAPEIGKGVYGKEIDVYALGIILHEMLTGRVPFDGETSQEIIMKHLTAVPQLDGVPDHFAGIIRRALAKDPAHRYSSVNEMRDRVLAGRAPNPAARPAEPVVAQVASPPRPVSAQVRKEPLYISDDSPDSEGMIFGPLRERTPSASPVVFTAPPKSSLARRFECGYGQFNSAFGNHRLGAILKIFALVALGIVVATQSWSVASIFLLVLAFYLIHTGLRMAAPIANSRGEKRVRQVLVRRSAEARAREACRIKSPQQRAAELFGALLQSALYCAVLSLFGLAVVEYRIVDSVEFWAHYTWLVVISTAGCWVLLGLGKAWEPAERNRRGRRGAMLLAGLFVGALAYGLGNYLEVPPVETPFSATHLHTVEWSGWYTPARAPLLPAYLAYFAGLWVVPRWWRTADPARRTRVALTGALGAGLWAWVMHLIVYFPQPSGVLVAVTMSLATQLAASWWDLKKETETRALAA